MEWQLWLPFFFGNYLLPVNQQQALLALRMLAPTIFFSAILGVMRGYFQAHSTMMPTSISQILEQIANAIVSILAAWLLIKKFAVDERRMQFMVQPVVRWVPEPVLTGLAFMLIVYAANRKSIHKRSPEINIHRKSPWWAL